MAEKYGWTVDPVDLLTGSFKWEYQDLALYGKTIFRLSGIITRPILRMTMASA